MTGSKYPTSGIYKCIGCNSDLYSAKSKFDSGCGWPAYYEGISGAIKELPDADGVRVVLRYGKGVPLKNKPLFSPSALRLSSVSFETRLNTLSNFLRRRHAHLILYKPPGFGVERR
eukprot:GSChrysophyteH1.ASY1.ANO1.2047.1 assembled CDS